MKSLEKINKFSSLEIEPTESAKIKLGIAKKKGAIEFQNVIFRYSDTMPDVLKNLSFKINSGEKVS